MPVWKQFLKLCQLKKGVPHRAMDIQFFTERRNKLGESPLWDPRSGMVWWVDILERKVFSATEEGVIKIAWEFELPVCSLGLASDHLIAACSNGFSLINEKGNLDYLVRLQLGDGVRMNDGKVDRFGNFVAGSMVLAEGSSRLGSLWRIDTSGHAREVEFNVLLSNSICFSPDGSKLYFSDTMDGVIRRYEYNSLTGDLNNRETFADTRKYGSVPDGATVDTEGQIWVALPQASSVACFSPEGKLMELVHLPVPHPSCPAFGGKQMETMYVTSISNSGRMIRSDHPKAGRLLQIRDLGVRGIPEKEWKIEAIA